MEQKRREEKKDKKTNQQGSYHLSIRTKIWVK